MTPIARFFIDKPLRANLIAILLLILGYVSFQGLKRQATPLVDMQQMRVISIIPSASPQDVELNVTTKIEDALSGVSGIKKYLSHSAEGRSTIEVFIDPDSKDPEKVKDNIRRAVETVQDLPDEMLDRPHIMEIKVDDMIVYELAMVFDEYEPGKIAELSRSLKRRLLEIDEIAQVRDNAIPEREIKILLNNEKLVAMQVSVEEVLQAIKLNKVRLAGGALESFRAEKGIITVSEFNDPQDMAKIVIRSTTGGRHIYVGDVARIEDGFAKSDKVLHFNGKRGASFLIIKKASADLLDMVDKVEELKEDFLRSSPEGLQLLTTWDFSMNTRSRLNIVSSNFAAGFVLVLMVLFMFLDARIAWWCALGIPVALAGAFCIMPFFDVTNNSVSLCGMILVLGMIVDDAIIIAESIYRHMEKGMKGKEAALLGLKDVIKPVFGTIVTSIIAFVPLYFLPGSIGDFAVEVPTVVIIVLASSFFEATLILPAHLGHGDKGTSSKRQPPGAKLMNRLESAYARLLGFLMQHHYLAATFAIATLILSLVLSLNLSRFRMFDLDQSYRIYIMGAVKEGSTLKFTQSQSSILESIISQHPEAAKSIQSVKSTIGEEGSFKGARYSSHTSFLMEVMMTPFTERELTAQELADWVKAKVAAEPRLILKKFDLEIDAEGPPVGRPLEIRVVGDDNAVRYDIIEKIKIILQDYPVNDVISDNIPGRQELQIQPDFERLSQAGLTVSSVASTIRTIFDGTVVGTLQTPIESSDYRLMMDEQFHDFNNPLQDIYVRNQYGHLLPIKGVMKEVRGRSAQKILHYNGHPSNLITANINKDNTSSEFYQDLSLRLKELNQQYHNYEIMLAGEAQESQNFMRHILYLLAMAVSAIYLWLVFQLESLSQPFMVVLAIPFGLAGMLMAFIFHGYDLSLLALVGVVGVGGVLVNDSLIMVEFINRLYRSGSSNLHQAIISGARYRFRPVMLTTLTTVTGLLPTAYGFIGGTDSFISPLVFAMTWGLLVGTPSVLIIIPLLYSVIFSAIEKLQPLLPKWSRHEA